MFKKILIVMAVLLGVLVLAVVVAYWKWTGVPRHRQVREARLAATVLDNRRNAAEDLEKDFTLALSYSGPTALAEARSTSASNPNAGLGQRTIRLSIQDINDWIESRSGLYPDRIARGEEGWVQHEGVSLPMGLSEPVVGIEGGRLVVSFMVRVPGFTKLISLYGEASVPEPGRLTVRLASIKGGNLTIPAQMMANRLPGKIGQTLAEGIAALYESRTVEVQWKLPGGGNRVVLLKDLKLEPDAIVATIDIVSTAPPR